MANMWPLRIYMYFLVTYMTLVSHVHSLDKPNSVVVSSRKTSSYVGEKDTFSCTATGGKPTPTLKIYFKRSGGTPVEVTQGQERVMAKEDNQAEYYCVATTSAWTMRSSSKTYSITFPNTSVFFTKNPTAAVQVGQVKTFRCETDESNPISRIRWAMRIDVETSFRDIRSGISLSERTGPFGGKIRISDVAITATKAMNGAVVNCGSKYRMMRHVETSGASETMDVKFPPDGIQLSETSITVSEGESKTITCRTTSSSHPPVSASVKKKLGSTEVDVSGFPSETDGANLGKDVSVDIKLDTNRKDNGAEYICTFTYASTTRFRKTATVNVQFKPTEITMINKPLKPVIEKKQFQVVCETDSANPAAGIKFYRKRVGENWVEMASGISTTTTDGEYNGKICRTTLTVTADRADDQAKFQCIVKGGFIPVAAQATVTLYYPRSASLSSNPKTVKEGDDVTLTCEASGGNPTTYRYSWYYKSKEIQNERSRTYTVRAVKYTQTGPYRCQVVDYSPGGTTDATLNINILYKAKWNPNFQKVLTVFRKPSESVRFVLRVIANPPPTNVSWLDEYNRPATDQGFSAEKANDLTYTLFKQAVALDDYAEYSATVVNDVGISVFTFRIMKGVAPNTTLTYVKRHGTRMTAKWLPLQHSYATLQIKYCRHDVLGMCRKHLVMNKTAGETSFEIEGSAMVKSVLVLYLEVFEGQDLVFRSTPVAESREGSTYSCVKDRVTRGNGTSVGMIVGIVIVALVVVAVIVTVVILHRRNVACFSGSKNEESGRAPSNSAAHQMEPMYANMNAPFEGGENAGTTQGENETHDLHLGKNETEYMNVAATNKGDYAEPHDIKDNPYAELNITADVIAGQTYSDLRH